MNGRSLPKVEPPGRDYCAIAEKYRADVLSGVIPACNFVRQACQRQADDRARKWQYRFDTNAASKVCRFIEKLPHVKGSEWSGKRIVLEPWQVFILTTVFGWVDASDKRRYRVVYVEVPRKNGKSFLSAGVGLYCLAADGETGAEVVTAATKADQARIVLDMARMMVRKTPALQSKLGLEAREHVIMRTHDASSFRALSKDNQGSQDGQNISCAIVDELHAHKTRDMWSSLDTATGARAQPLIWTITTAGSNRAGICYEQRDYLKKVLGGQQEDDRTFGVIYTCDEGDSWASEDTWRKANPNYGVSVNPDDLRRKATKALKVASAQNEFLTKHLDVWVNASTAWMNMPAWDACADLSLELTDFEGKPCDIGLDLASKVDVAAKAYVFEEDGLYTIFCEHYLPEAAIEDSSNAQYDGWRREDWLTVTDGNTTDFDRIEDDLRSDASRFGVQSVAYDPWQATELANKMLAEGCPMVEVRPSVQNFSEPMKLFEALVIDKKIRHNGDPVLAWMISNVVAKMDAKDNIYPRKEFPENKIDAVVAILAALSRKLGREQQGECYLDSNPVLYVG